MWFWLIVIAVIVGGIISASNGEGFTEGAVAGGLGCASVLFRLFIAGLSIFAVIWLFGAIFG
jgi:hypothetical protein